MHSLTFQDLMFLNFKFEGEYVSLKSVSSDRSLGSVDSSNWQAVLEQRLQREVKDKELEYFLSHGGDDMDANFGPVFDLDELDSNWATQHQKHPSGKFLGDNRDILGRHIFVLKYIHHLYCS